MKVYVRISLFLILAMQVLSASDNRVFDGNSMFKGFQRIDKITKGDQPLETIKINTVATSIIDKSYADGAFLNGNKEICIRNFPINTLETGSIILRKTMPAVDANTKWILKSRTSERSFKGPAVVTYEGAIEGEASTSVFLTYSGGILTGYIESLDGYKYDISTDAATLNTAARRIVVSEQNYRQRLNNSDANPFQCLTDETLPEDLHEYLDYEKHGPVTLGASTKLLECRISIEAINNFYVLMNSNYEQAASYIAAVMSHVSYLYEEHLNVRIYLPLVKIWEEEDYYTSEADFNGKLELMPVVWDYTQPESSALTCMFAALSGQPSGSTVAGLSYGGIPGLGSLCNGERGYSIFGITGGEQYPNYNYTWDVSVAAHEIGHNFGSPHTHHCYYLPNVIDTCVTKDQPLGGISDACFNGTPKPQPGTIMSYCHLTNSTGTVELHFHPREIPNMRYAAQYNSCIKEPASAVIDILSPLIDNYYIGGQQMKIRWTSSKVNYVNIYYSLNDGADWIQLATNIAANDSTYTWSVPQSNTTTGLIKISDASNPDVSDITDVNFTIIVPTIVCTSPLPSKHYGIRETINVTWTSNYSKKFNIYFSSDGGTSWNTIATNYLAYYYNMKNATTVPSDNCLIKISDAEDNSIVTISSLFGIGEETLHFTYPRPGDTLCSTAPCNITWESDYLNNIYLYYSSDNGEKWSKVKVTNIDATPGLYQWTLPSVTNPTQYLLKAVLKDDQTVILDQLTSPFVIDTCIPSGVNDYVAESGISILSISPNPVDEIAEIEYSIDSDLHSSIEFYITDMNGAIAIRRSIENAGEGRHSFSIYMKNLSTGSYFLVVRTQKGSDGFPFRIVR